MRSETWQVVAVWLASRIVIAATLGYACVTTGLSPEQALSHWDVANYLEVARSGYADPELMAFFPGLPMLLRALDWIGLPAAIAGAALANVASLVAALALERLFGRWAAFCWLAAPMGVFTAVAYTEPFFCAAAFWAWERAESGRWHHAAGLALIACTLRISGLFLVAALIIKALCDSTSWAMWFRAVSWVTLALVAPACFAAYLFVISGDPLAWYTAQHSGWQRSLSWPWDALMATWPMTSADYWPGRPEVPVMFRFEICSVVLGYAAALVALVKRRWGEATWIGINVVALSSSGWFLSVNRAVIVWFPLFGFVGEAIERIPSGTPKTIAGIVALGIDVILGSWWSWCFFTGAWAS